MAASSVPWQLYEPILAHEGDDTRRRALRDSLQRVVPPPALFGLLSACKEILEASKAKVFAAEAVVTELRAQLASARERGREAWDRTNDAESRADRLDETVEAGRETTERLRAEVRALKEERSKEQRAAFSATRALKDLQSESATLHKQVLHWRKAASQLMVQRDAAVGQARSFRDALRDAPGHIEGETAALLRAQLITCRVRKAEHKKAAAEERARADKAESKVKWLEETLMLQVEEDEKRKASERAETLRLRREARAEPSGEAQSSPQVSSPGAANGVVCAAQAVG
jgi:FtsZ-binding cell division protein ZapB